MSRKPALSALEGSRSADIGDGHTLTIFEAAEALGVSDKTLRRWHAVGYGPKAIRKGLRGDYRYSARGIDSWLSAIADEPTIEIRRSVRVA